MKPSKKQKEFLKRLDYHWEIPEKRAEVSRLIDVILHKKKNGQGGPVTTDDKISFLKRKIKRWGKESSLGIEYKLFDVGLVYEDERVLLAVDSYFKYLDAFAIFQKGSHIKLYANRHSKCKMVHHWYVEVYVLRNEEWVKQNETV